MTRYALKLIARQAYESGMNLDTEITTAHKALLDRLAAELERSKATVRLHKSDDPADYAYAVIQLGRNTAYLYFNGREYKLQLGREDGDVLAIEFDGEQMACATRDDGVVPTPGEPWPTQDPIDVIVRAFCDKINQRTQRRDAAVGMR